MSNGIEDDGGEGMLNCISRWIRHADKQSGGIHQLSHNQQMH